MLMPVPCMASGERSHYGSPKLRCVPASGTVRDTNSSNILAFGYCTPNIVGIPAELIRDQGEVTEVDNAEPSSFLASSSVSC